MHNLRWEPTALTETYAEVDFESLICPLTTEDFFAHLWEKNVTYFPKNDQAFLQKVFSIQDVDDILSSYQLKSSECRVVKHNSDIRHIDYVNRRTINRGVVREDIIDKEKMFASYKDGGTIILEGAQHFSLKMARLCRSLEKSMGHRVNANIYITPAKAQGFPLHFDTHDLFVFQIHGTKTWNIYGSPITLPLYEQGSTCQVPATRMEAQIEMQTGDLLYMPRGFQHEALTQSEASIHITLGVYPILWSEVLTDYVKWLSKQNSDFRKSLPRFISQSEDQDSFMKEVHSLLHAKSDSKNVKGFFREIQSKFIGRHSPLFKDHLQNIGKINNLNASTRLKIRVENIYQIYADDLNVNVIVHHQKMTFPKAVLGAIEFMELGPFSISDLSGLNESEQILLCSRLLDIDLLEITV